MHSFEVHSNESACIKKVRLGLEQVYYQWGRKDAILCLNRHGVTPGKKILTQTWVNRQRQHTLSQAILGCNMLKIRFFMLIKTIWIYPTLKSTRNIPSQ